MTGTDSLNNFPTPKDLMVETLVKIEEEIKKQSEIVESEKLKLKELNLRRLNYEEIINRFEKEEKAENALKSPNKNHLPNPTLPVFPVKLIEGKQASSRVYKLLSVSHFMDSSTLVELYKKEFRDDTFNKSKLYAALYQLQLKGAICFGPTKDLPADKIKPGSKGNTLYRKWTPVELKEKFIIPTVTKSPAIIGGSDETTGTPSKA